MIGRKAVAARWFLLCALAFGLVGMHHLAWQTHCAPPQQTAAAGTPGPTAATVPAQATTKVMAAPGCCGGHSGGHGLLHLCLVILAFALTLGVALLRWRRPAEEAARGSGPASVRWERVPRAPPDSATALSSLGVLRL